MSLTGEMEQYALSTKEEVLQFMRELAPIPAPSHHEEKRAEWVKNWMEKNGAKGVFIDDALNVEWPVKDDGVSDMVVFMAHTDVVFPDTEALPFTEDEEKMYCPGVGDDTGNLASLLYAVRFFTQNKIEPAANMLIVANSCEEGLGNLKGSRFITDKYGSRIKAFFTVDGGFPEMVTTAVGSHRYRVTVKTEGGHSYGAFGNRNAIAYLASMIDTLYKMKVPSKEGTKTTYNVGVIEGGTSVNTICQEASMLFEYRSDDRECLKKMQNLFEKVIEAYQAMEIEVSAELLGDRPCGGNVPQKEYDVLKEITRKAGREILGIEIGEHSGSTDANYPLSLGIPAICVGGCTSGGTHTRSEWLEKSSLYDGVRFVMDILSNYFKV